MEYKTLFQQIVEEAKEVTGEVAVTQANRVEGVEIENGEIQGDIGQQQVEELIHVFDNIMGDGAKAIARKAVKDLYKQDKSVKDLEIPENITPDEVKAERFASSL